MLIYFRMHFLTFSRYLLRGTSPLTSLGIKVKGSKGEKVKGCRGYIKSKKQVM